MSNTTSIREIVLQNQEAIATKAISEKIFTLMKNIRNGCSDESYQRRWVWELLQNAMDTTNSERSTKVQISINEGTNDLHFLHNGNPFKVENITYLVNQQSSKPRQINIHERKRTIGKFGTGFITTHLLSEKVTLKSTVDAENLGHKRFEILLDRSGNDEAELFEGVKKSMDILLNLDQLPEVVNYNRENLNTEFVYHLSDKGMMVAKTGINDLMASLPFTMAFVRNIDTVEITNYGTFKYKGFETLSSNVYIHNISINDCELRKILTLESSEYDAIIAIEIKYDCDKIQFIELEERTPRLFCNYPFIGTEKMNLPLIFNSSSFNVYQERRNGIILKNADTVDILENKKLIKECKKLLLDLLDFVSDSQFEFENTYVLADCKMPDIYEWLYAKWYEDQILNSLKNAILKAKLVETEKDDIISRKPICGTNETINFPFHKDENVRENIYDVCNTPSHFSLPLRKHIHKWHKINWWNGSYDLSIKNLANWFSSLKSLQNIKMAIGIDNNFIKWVENFLAVLNKEETVIGIINQNKLPIYPNQNGDLVTKNLIYWDNGDIPEELKNILQNLGIDIRKILLNKDLFIGGGIAIDKERNIDVKYVVNQIKEQVNKYNSEKMKGGSLSVEIQSTFKDLYIWLCENQSYSALFGELYKNKETRLLDEETIKLSIESDKKTKAVMDKYGISSIDELEEMLIKNVKTEKDSINPENLLISLGITSVADLEKAKKIFLDNKEISEALQHNSINDLERLEKVMSMIKRSKENVYRKLASLPEYDCTNWRETSLTTVSGIIKNGKPIDLVIRPGDGNQIILFYSQEFDTLENNINELWYDKGSEQYIYTFGKFLKRAKISRMPI
jgi:hypothetical protein